MAYLRPVHQVFGMEDGDTGEHGKGGADQEIVVALAGDGRVGIAALQDGVVELTSLQRMLIVDFVVSLIDHLREDGGVLYFLTFAMLGKSSCREHCHTEEEQDDLSACREYYFFFFHC